MPKSKLTAKDVRGIARFLEKAHRKRKCHFCNKTECDGLMQAIVHIHMKCAKKSNTALLKAMKGES